ncbi:hypothetical protein [Pectobacterium versatile]|uniref:hypothetical protein n=1 Tax=Pectobacterium versatile TaxID=2488639 RepID=UPI001F210235|nr:hypothetical protein [Pectobacterium versatile]
MTPNMMIGLALILVGCCLMGVICMFVYSRDDTQGHQTVAPFRLDEHDNERWIREQLQTRDLDTIPSSSNVNDQADENNVLDMGIEEKRVRGDKDASTV